MATRPSGLRQPSAIRASNSNISSAGSTSGMQPPETPGPTPAKQTPAGSGLPLSRLPSSSSIRRKIATPVGINPPGSRDSGLATDIDSFIIGDTVYVNGDTNKRGKICFIGEVGFAKGDFAGIALDLPMGNHDGVVQGKRYFQCAPSHGLFTKLNRLSRDPVLESPSTPRAPESLAGSTVVSPAPQMSRSASIVAERTPSPGGMRTPVKSSSPGISSNLTLGERVIVASATGGTKIGILRFLGTTDFAAGEWAGVELLTPMGKNNGSVAGKSYFTCKDKHGLFVPASKVISSPVNKTPRRHGSRESLISVSSMASSAASRSIRRPSARDSQCLPTCSLQSVLAEKEKHMERLIKERELDRVDLANLSREYEEKNLEVKRLQAECATYLQQMQSSSGDSEAVTRLQNQLEEEHRKLEDLQYTLDEEKIMKADLQAQLDAVMAKTPEGTKPEISQAVFEDHQKEMEALKTQLEKYQDEAKSANENLLQALRKIELFEAASTDLNQNVKVLSDEISAGKEERSKLVSDHQAEVAALKKTIDGNKESISALNQKISDKKRHQDELKEKCEKLQVELETTLKQKSTLEAEVMDLANSKTDTSEILTNKIKDLTDEIQDLRAKLQSEEEDKAVLRRINREFKSRIAQNEQGEISMKKELEDASIKFAEEKATLEKELNEKLSDLESEKQKVLEQLKIKEDETTLLKSKVAAAEQSAAEAALASKEYLQQIETLKSNAAGSGKQVEEYQSMLRNLEIEKNALQAEKVKHEKDLSEKCKELSTQIEQLTEQLSSSANESSSLKKEIEMLKAEVAKSTQITEEKTAAIKTLQEEVSVLTKKLEEEGSALDHLSLEVDKLKKDKSSLKEQLSAYKTESSRFQEIEEGLSQELVNLRNKLEQKNKMVSDLEKELSEKKADIESSKAQLLDSNSPQAHIDFLNSIIVDLQRKNEELNVKLNVLINGVDADANSNRVPGANESSAPRTLQSLRPYCDICEKFDLHDTEDCPAQVSEENTHYSCNRGEPRPYCDSCEIFGHATGECDDQETY